MHRLICLQFKCDNGNVFRHAFHVKTQRVSLIFSLRYFKKPKKRHSGKIARRLTILESLGTFGFPNTLSGSSFCPGSRRLQNQRAARENLQLIVALVSRMLWVIDASAKSYYRLPPVAFCLNSNETFARKKSARKLTPIIN